MTAPLVYVVVLNWRDSAATFACLEALGSSTWPNLRVVVVDNASTDGSADTLATMDTIDLVRNPVNLGFTGGVNTGLRHALSRGADYIWLLNSDATVAPDTLSLLVAAAEADPSIGLVSPVFHDPDDPARVEVLLARFDPLARYASQTTDPAEAAVWLRDHPDQVVLLGTALLVRRALAESIGGLDERFFAYVEDVDYSLRAIAAGFRNVAVPEAVVGHRFKAPLEDPSGVPPYLHYYITRNYLLLWHKLPGSLWRKGTWWFLLRCFAGLKRLRDDRVGRDALLAGLWDGLRNIGGPYDPARRMPLLPRAVIRLVGPFLVAAPGR